MPGAPVREFPLFPLGLVALPGEVVPLHIFEERFKTMMERCLADESEFGIVWLSDDGLREIGCACEITEVADRTEDGKLDVLTRGTRPFQILEREDQLPYPAGTVEFLADRDEAVDDALATLARETYAELVERATDNRPDPLELAQMSAYAMAATVDFGLDAKQGLLDIRSENARLRLVTRLFRAAMKRIEFVSHAQTRARSNGKVRFT
jgi:Lon protease-like protein